MHSNSSSKKFVCIDGFGEELDEIIYEGMSNWFVSFRSPFTVYSAHFSYIVVFFIIVCCGILSFRHSVENGKKYTQYWWGALIQGVLSEKNLMSTKYWHAQAPIMFLGKQLPLHIVLLYPFLIYICTMAIQRLQLCIFTEPAAIGLLVMLMEIPFRMISVKFLHLTYHDTEPMFFHKLCGVPLVEIFSSLLLATSYAAVYHLGKYYYTRDLSVIWNKSEPDKKETYIMVMCGVISPIFAFIQKIIFFHFLYDFFNVNPISCLFFTISLYLSFILCFEPRKGEKHITEDSTAKNYLFYQIALYFFCLLYLALFGRPQNEVSIGTHEPTGDCTTLVCGRTPLGKPVKRKKYLCADEVAARKNFVYNFDCLEDGPPCLNAVWYTICGSPIYNRAQFILNILSFVILLASIFSKILFPDINKMEMLKKFMMKFHRPAPPEEAESVPTEEITVGFVLIQQDALLSSLGSLKNIQKKLI